MCQNAERFSCQSKTSPTHEGGIAKVRHVEDFDTKIDAGLLLNARLQSGQGPLPPPKPAAKKKRKPPFCKIVAGMELRTINGRPQEIKPCFAFLSLFSVIQPCPGFSFSKTAVYQPRHARIASKWGETREARLDQ